MVRMRVTARIGEEMHSWICDDMLEDLDKANDRIDIYMDEGVWHTLNGHYYFHPPWSITGFETQEY